MGTAHVSTHKTKDLSPRSRRHRKPKTPARKLRILIADDEDDTRHLLRAILEARGWDVLEASDGQQAFEMIIDEMPDVALVDNRMPARTGTEVYRQIRKGDILTPVVLMTAASRVSEVARSIGLRHFLPKPFSPMDVVSALEQAIAEGGERTEATG